jgi:hypothetical protein
MTLDSWLCELRFYDDHGFITRPRIIGEMRAILQKHRRRAAAISLAVSTCS